MPGQVVRARPDPGAPRRHGRLAERRRHEPHGHLGRRPVRLRLHRARADVRARRSRRPGTYLYHCTIHKFMRGEVVVVPVALQAPAEPVIVGRPGRARRASRRPGRRASSSSGSAAAGGSSAASTPAGRRQLHAVAARLHAAPTSPRVAKGRVEPARARRGRAEGARAAQRRHACAASAARKRPGARAVLQRYVRELFAWRDRLDGAARRVVEGRVRAAARAGPLPRRRPRQPRLGRRHLAHRRRQARRRDLSAARCRPAARPVDESMQSSRIFRHRHVTISPLGSIA